MPIKFSKKNHYNFTPQPNFQIIKREKKHTVHFCRSIKSRASYRVFVCLDPNSLKLGFSRLNHKVSSCDAGLDNTLFLEETGLFSLVVDIYISEAVLLFVPPFAEKKAEKRRPKMSGFGSKVISDLPRATNHQIRTWPLIRFQTFFSNSSLRIFPPNVDRSQNTE